jgi:acyl carrier protein
MSKELIKNQVVQLLKENGILTLEEGFDPSASLSNEYGLTSLGVVQLIVALETEYNIEFKDSELILENYDCINSIVDCLNDKLIQSDSGSLR